MKLFIPETISPQFDGITLVSHPQIGSTAEYDGGTRAKFISDYAGIPTIVFNRPIPHGRILDLGGSMQRTEANYTALVQRAADLAIKHFTDDLPSTNRYVHAGNSAGGLTALVAGLSREDTDAIIALEPTAQVTRNRTVSFANYIKQFRVESDKTAEQTEAESLGMPPFRTPAQKLVPRMLHELIGNQNVWTTNLSTELVKRSLGNRALKLFVMYAEKSPLASSDEQQAMLASYAKIQHSPIRKKLFVQPGTFHSSTDKPLYFIKALDELYPLRIAPSQRNET
jgi:acetyl esterase/lipase